MTRTMRCAMSAGVAVVVAAIPLIAGDYYLTLLNYIGVYSLVALGLVLLTGSGGITSFGQAALVGIGAYTTAYLTTKYAISPWLTLPVALALSAAVAVVLGFICLRLGGHYLPLTTIAWGLAIYLLFGNLESLGRHGGIAQIPPVSLFGTVLDRMDKYYYLIWFFVGICVLAAANLLGSRQGRAIRAMRGGATMAESLGIDTFRVRLAVFVIAALLAGLSGWLYAHMQRFVSPTPFGLTGGIEFLLMAVVGGSGYILGAVVGAAVITLLRNLLQDVLPLITSQSGNLEIVVYGSLFILLLQNARGGIVGFIAHRLPRRKTAPIVSSAAAPLPKREHPEVGETLLTVEGLTKRFGGLVAVDNVGFTLKTGEILGLIGPNGAGKSTTFNLISGALKPSAGRVFFRGAEVTGTPPRKLAEQGLARTFQHVKLRPNMSLLENVMLGLYPRTRSGYVAGALRLDQTAENSARAEAMTQLERVGLHDKPFELAGNLPLGQQRLLELARSLAADPSLIMLDEPAAGLRRQEKDKLADLLRALRAGGVTILLVEHDMDFVMGLVDRIVMLDFGRLLAEGLPAEIRANPIVQEAYLGGVA